MWQDTGKINILLVDDKKENLFALESILNDLDVQIFKALSGEQALNFALDHDFALMLIDVQMPEMNGFELAEYLRGTERTKTIPIIFVTAAAQTQEFSFRGYESGAVDLLYKPIDTFILKSKVKIFIELYQQKRLLKKQKESAEAADKVKSAFLANMSHEIRTPLNAIIGFTNLLKEPRLPSEQHERYIDIIDRSGKALTRIIDDILDISKIDAGQLKIEAIRFSPMELANEVIELMSIQAQLKNIALKIETLNAIPETIVSDPIRLRQILLNIIGNAIKFTEQGSVTLTISACAQSNSITFLVTDTGIGIAPEDHKKLFQAFAQADISMTRKFGGTGLGLLLSKRLAAALKGDVVLKESRLGHGSVFEIRVSTKLSNETVSLISPITSKVEAKTMANVSEASTPQQNLQGIKVLLAEDSEDNRILIQHILKKSGVQLDCVSNGADAVDQAMTHDYDIVLMDIQMPVKDGYSATQELRQKKYKKPIIAFTAHAMLEDRKKCLAVGCTDYLAKPINKGQLLQKISTYSRRAPAASNPVFH